MTDNTAKERVARQRAARLKAGWVQINLWVPSQADADELKRRAADMRAAAKEE